MWLRRHCLDDVVEKILSRRRCVEDCGRVGGLGGIDCVEDCGRVERLGGIDMVEWTWSRRVVWLCGETCLCGKTVSCRKRWFVG